MSLFHPHPNGGEEPLGNSVGEADSRFAKALALSNRYQDELPRFGAMMTHYEDGPKKERLSRLIVRVKKFIPKVSTHIELVAKTVHCDGTKPMTASRRLL